MDEKTHNPKARARFKHYFGGEKEPGRITKTAAEREAETKKVPVPRVRVAPRIDHVFTDSLAMIQDVLDTVESLKQKNDGRMPLEAAQYLEKMSAALVRLSREYREIQAANRDRKMDTDELLALIVEDAEVVTRLLDLIQAKNPLLLKSYVERVSS